MSHIIQPENHISLRNKCLKFIALTLQALNKKKEFDKEAKDMTAFIILLLNEIKKDVNKTVHAWEKRGFWIKADQFKLEWQWCQDFIDTLNKALKENNWDLLESSQLIIEKRCNKKIISNKMVINSPWEGAYAKLKKEPQ